MATLEELVVKISTDSKGVKEGEKEINKSFDGLSKSAKKLGAVIGAAFAVKKIVDFGKASVEAATLQIEQETKLATVLRERTNATDEQITSIKELASAQQQLGVIGDEVQLAGAQQLGTFVKQTSTIETLLPSLNNLVAQQKGYEATAGDATNIANLFGKVLEGQVGALSRVGISFTEAQEEVLKFGTEEERAATLAEVIQSNLGDVNSALAETDAGKIQQARNAFGDLQERIGSGVLPILGSLASFFTKTFIPFLDSSVVFIQSAASSLSDTLAPAFELLQGPMEEFSEMLRWIEEGFGDGFVPGLINAGSELSRFGGNLLNSAISFVGPVIEKLGEILPKFIEGLVEKAPSVIEQFLNTRMTIIQTLLEALPQILDVGIKILTSLIEGVVYMLPQLVQMATEIITNLIDTFVEMLPEILDTGMQLLMALIEGIIDVLPDLIKAALEIIVTLIEVLVENLPKIIEMGIEILLALIEGIIDVIPDLITAIVELIPIIIKAITDNLPKIIEAGIDIIFALIEGLMDASDEIGQAIIDLAPVLLKALADLLPVVLEAALDIGKAIVDGIIDGVGNLGSLLGNKLKDGATNGISAIKKKLRINSPSKVTEEIGQFTADGFIKGIEERNRMIENAGTGMATQAIQSAQTESTSPVNNVKNSRDINIQNLYVSNEPDIQQFNRRFGLLQTEDDRDAGWLPN